MHINMQVRKPSGNLTQMLNTEILTIMSQEPSMMRVLIDEIEES